MAYVLLAVVLAVVVFVVTEPLRRRAAGGYPNDEETGDGPPAEVLELEAARDAKYREIRDAELDHQTGKLADADWTAIDSTLRSQAIQILRELDRVSGRPPDRD
jgi:hypothetical protein